MFCALLLLLTLAAPPADPVAAALESYRNVASYRVTLRSGHGNGEEVIRYSYKKPGFIRMEFVKPHPGALLVYNPLSKTVRLRPFGFTKSLILTLSPDNRLVKSARGHTVDASDIGALLTGVQALQARGATSIQGEETVAGKPTLMVEVEGEPGVAVDGVHRYRLWLDPATWLPLRVLAYGPSGDIVDEARMDDLEVNMPLDEGLFAF